MKSDLQREVISHPHVIYSPIANYFIEINLYDENGGKNTKLHLCIIPVSGMCSMTELLGGDVPNYVSDY